MPDLGGAFPGTPAGQSDRPDDERGRLLGRIAGASVPSRTLVELIVEVEGLDCFTTQALERMTAVLDIIEGRENGLCN